MRRLALSTRNQTKRVELERLLEGVDVQIITPDDIPDWPEVEETGETFVDNAILKAAAGADATGTLAIADDSGLEVDALDRRPGIFSARFSGEGATDHANNAKLLRLLEGVPPMRRTARYRCAIAIASPDRVALNRVVLDRTDRRSVWTVQESCEGRIALEPRGSGGFGYDPLFEVAGAGGRRFSEMTPEEKDRLSHRGKAFRRAHPELLQRLGAAARSAHRSRPK